MNGSAARAQPVTVTPGSPPSHAASEVQFSLACGQPDYARMVATAHYLVVSQPRANTVLLFDTEELAPRLITLLEGVGRNAGQFDRPGGVAVDVPRGLLYVSDTFNHRIQVFRLPAGAARWGEPIPFAKAIGREGTGDGEFKQPGSLAVDAQGNLFVIDAGNARVQVFGADLRFARAWGTSGDGDGQFRSPIDLALGPDGSVVYVLDAGQRRVQAFAPDGAFRFAWGQMRVTGMPSSTGGVFLSPFGVATGRDGSVYVTDCGAHEVQQFDTKGTFVTSWGRFGTGNGDLNQPRQIAVDSRDHVVVLDFGNRRGQLFTTDGRFLSMFRVTRSGLGAQKMPTAAPR